MRFFVVSILLAAFGTSCHMNDKKLLPIPPTDQAQEKILKDTANFTMIEWLDSTTKRFGKIQEGQKLDVLFRFKNAGDKPLVITRVQPSCGCTIAEQPTEPVLPQKEGIIKAVFDSDRHVGINNKTLYVFANTKGNQSNELKFYVEVEKKKW
jgi:hypothetical protein